MITTTSDCKKSVNILTQSNCYVRRLWTLLGITSFIIPWEMERICIPFLVLRVRILQFLFGNVFARKHESCLKRLIWKELLILSILLRTRRSKRLALNPHLDFTDDRKIHFGRKRRLARDPREDIHRLTVQQRFILIQLITRQTIDLPLKDQAHFYVLLRPLSQKEIDFKHSSLTRAMNETLAQCFILS